MPRHRGRQAFVATEADGPPACTSRARHARAGSYRPSTSCEGRVDPGAARAEARADRSHRRGPAATTTPRRWANACRGAKSTRSCSRTCTTARCSTGPPGRRSSRRRVRVARRAARWATPRWKPRNAAGLALGVRASRGRRRRTRRSAPQRLLFDAATPGVGLALLFGVMLVLTLAEATRHRQALERVVQHQREQAARIAGELDAARRIQTAMLPRADSLRRRTPRRPRRDDDAGARGRRRPLRLLPARRRRLFFLVGDVAGKGLSASIFMAVSKALYKSTTLRDRRAGHRRADDRGQRRSLARQPADAVRHRIRRHARSRHGRARVLQRGPREPVPDPPGRCRRRAASSTATARRCAWSTDSPTGART